MFGPCAHTEQPGSYNRVELEMTMMLHRVDQNWDEHLQSLATDAIVRLPQYSQRLTYRLIVKTFPDARTLWRRLLIQYTQRMFAIIAVTL